MFFSCAAMVITSTIVRGSRLNFNGKAGDVTVLCPSTRMGFSEISTLSMVPSVKL